MAARGTFALALHGDDAATSTILAIELGAAGGGAAGGGAAGDVDQFARGFVAGALGWRRDDVVDADARGWRRRETPTGAVAAEADQWAGRETPTGAVAAEADQWAEEFVRSAIDSAVSVAESAAPPKPRVHSGAVVFRAASLREDTAWAECYDDEGNVYFANSNTGETSWTRPPELN